MKSENTTFYNTDDNSEHILTVKRKKFPWWVLLFLLIPLFFIIKWQLGNEVAVVPPADSTQKDTVANIDVQSPRKKVFFPPFSVLKQKLILSCTRIFFFKHSS